ncbi:MAG: hypothetical protein Q9184_008518 [Pyrenodesmia sp. 2 TL-2023]
MAPYWETCRIRRLGFLEPEQQAGGEADPDPEEDSVEDHPQWEVEEEEEEEVKAQYTLPSNTAGPPAVDKEVPVPGTVPSQPSAASGSPAKAKETAMLTASANEASYVNFFSVTLPSTVTEDLATRKR